jgi:hypothetical protein
MRDRSKFIVTIFTVIMVTVIALFCGGQRVPVTAASTPTNVPGPSQFYLQHNLISDGFVPADLTHSNLVNAWGLVAGPTIESRKRQIRKQCPNLSSRSWPPINQRVAIV